MGTIKQARTGAGSSILSWSARILSPSGDRPVHRHTLPKHHVARDLLRLILALMHGARSRSQQLPSNPLRLVACLILLCHMCSATPLVAFVIATLADLDGSHSVHVEYDSRGVRIRLHHQSGDFTPCSCDHHTLAGRVAAVLCHSSAEGDHVMTASLVSASTDIKQVRRTEALGRERLASESLAVVPAVATLPSVSRKVTMRQGLRVPSLFFHRCIIASVCLLV